MGHGSKDGKGTADSDITELTLRTVMRGSRLIRQIMEPFFSSMGISPSQWVVMRVMHAHERETGGPIRLVELSARLMIRQPTLTAAINKLVIQGLVQRTSPGENQRGRLVKLTPKGRKTMDRTVALHRDRAKELFSVWDANDMEKITGLFQKLEEHLLRHIPRNPEQRPGSTAAHALHVRSEL